MLSKLRTAASGAGFGPRLIEGAFGCYQLRLGHGTVDVDNAADALHGAETQLAHGDARS